MSKRLVIAAVASFLCASLCAFGAELQRPKAGKTEIFHLKDIKPGMQATAWTVFSGTEPEPVPVEIIGVWNGPAGSAPAR